MPLAIRDYFLPGIRVIEHIRTEVSGDYTMEHYAVLSDFKTHSGFIFFYKDKEYIRDFIFNNFEYLIEFHMKKEILNLYPMRTINA